jgi:hypothetical protein
MNDGTGTIHDTGMGSQDGEGTGQVADSRTTESDCQERGLGPMGESGYIYFAETEDGQFVKIGFSWNPIRRLYALGTLRPSNFRIRLIGFFPGTLQAEHELHKQFISDRDNGEWFRSTTDLRDFIKSINLVRPEDLEEAGRPKTRRYNVSRKTKRPPKDSIIPDSYMSLGGVRRAERLTPQRRSEIAQLAGKVSAERLTTEEHRCRMKQLIKLRWERYRAQQQQS